MAGKNFARMLINAKDMGRFEGMRAYMEVALVAIHNIAVDSQMPKKWEKKICEKLDAEIARILQVTEAMSAEDIGAAVVQFAEKARREADAAPRES